MAEAKSVKTSVSDRSGSVHYEILEGSVRTNGGDSGSKGSRASIARGTDYLHSKARDGQQIGVDYTLPSPAAGVWKVTSGGGEGPSKVLEGDKVMTRSQTAKARANPTSLLETAGSVMSERGAQGEIRVTGANLSERRRRSEGSLHSHRTSSVRSCCSQGSNASDKKKMLVEAARLKAAADRHEIEGEAKQNTCLGEAGCRRGCHPPG